MSVEDKFHAAVNVIRSLPKNGSYQPSNELLLRFYAFYKQATEGPNRSPKPAFWELVKKAKWDAWQRLGDMSRQKAMIAYVDELNKIVETMAYTDNVADFLSSVDSFYTTIPAEDLEMCIGPALEKVRSQPNSPLASRNTSPVRIRNSPANQGLKELEDDDDDEDFLDTFEQAVPMEKDEVKRFTGQTHIPNGILPNGKLAEPLEPVLVKAVEAMRADIATVNQRLQRLEERYRSMDWRRKPWGGIPKEIVILFLVWPLALNFFFYWMNKRAVRKSRT